MFEGDPKLTLGPNGSNLEFKGGQPVMDTGLSNHVLISLFTAPGWVGNHLIKDPARKIGSNVEEEARKPITKTSMNKVRQAIVRAVESDKIKSLDVDVSNPSGHRRTAEIKVQGAGGSPPDMATIFTDLVREYNTDKNNVHYQVRVFDDFNRDDGSLGGNWSDFGTDIMGGTFFDGALGILSGKVYRVTGSEISGALYTAKSFGPDQYVELQLPAVTSMLNNTIFLFFLRASTSNPGYAMSLSMTPSGYYGAYLFAFDEVDGTDIVLAGPETGHANDNDIVRFQVVDNLLTGFVGGTEIISVADSLLTDGYPGIGGDFSDSGYGVDNFEAGDL